MNLVLPTPLEPLLGSFSTNSKMQGGHAPRLAHSSCALVKEVDNTCFVDLVAGGEHPQVGLRPLCKCAKLTACGIINVIQGIRLERLGDAFRQADTLDKTDA